MTPYQKNLKDGLGNFPVVFYGEYQIDYNDIIYFSIYYMEGLPCISITFNDSLNLMRDKGFPLDDMKIKIFLNPRSLQLKEILLQFKITHFKAGNNCRIDGVIDVNLLHISEYKSYPNMTSFYTLRQICKDAGLGFNTNISDTNDVMTRINPGNKVNYFIMEITESSYLSDNSFMYTFIDYYYNLNYIDVAKELERNADNDYGVTDNTLGSVLNLDEKESVTKLIFSNDESFRETNMYFSTYDIINNSTEISLETGYTSVINYYDESSKEILTFNIDSITSKGDKTIILKGLPQDNEFYKLNKTIYYTGRMDEDNTHKNYPYALIHNEKNLFELGKIGLRLNMGIPNYSVYKFQKIKVFISNQTHTPSANLKNERLSGDWIISDISYVFSNGEFKQVIDVIKRELELSNDELATEK
jgi:hypothetical protein